MPSQRASTNILSDGRCRSSNDCEANPPKHGDGSTLPVSASHNSSLTGTSSPQPHAELWEPYDGRLSRTVLREREGEVPSRHSPGQIRLAQHVDSANGDDGCRPSSCSPQSRLANGYCRPPLGSPENVQGSCVSGQLTLSWDAPAVGTAGTYRYGIYRDEFLVRRVTGGSTAQTSVTVAVTDTTITYYAEVQARSSTDSSGYAETGGFTCTQPTPVVSLNATNLSVGETSSVQITATLDVVSPSTASVRFTLSGATNGNGSCSAGADFYVSGT